MRRFRLSNVIKEQTDSDCSKSQDSGNAEQFTNWSEVLSILFLKACANLLEEAHGVLRIESFSALQANLSMDTQHGRVVPTTEYFFYFLLHEWTVAYGTLFKWKHAHFLTLESSLHCSGSGR